MTKEDFIKKLPDIKVQQFETETILSKQEIMDIVEQVTQSMDMGLVYYEHCGCNITVFTSDKMKAELAKMVPGYSNFSFGINSPGLFTLNLKVLFSSS